MWYKVKRAGAIELRKLHVKRTAKHEKEHQTGRSGSEKEEEGESPGSGKDKEGGSEKPEVEYLQRTEG